MDLSAINPWAILVAAVSSFLVGGLWYSPILFAKPWMAANGFTEEDLKKSHMGKIFGGSFVLSLVMATNLAFFLGPKATLTWGLAAGALAGVGWVAASTAVIYLFERKRMSLFLINGGYQAVTLTLMGGILGAWH
jgi:hypothetical protein